MFTGGLFGRLRITGEVVEKALEMNFEIFWGGHFTLPDLKIVNSGPFYEVDLYSWNKKVTLWDFFDSLGSTPWSGKLHS